MSSRRAQVGWSTSGHSGIDVNLYLHPSDLHPSFRGSRENTDVGLFIRDHLGLDLESITTKLNENTDWFFWRSTSKKEKGGQQRRAVGKGLGGSCPEDGLTHYHCGKH